MRTRELRRFLDWVAARKAADREHHLVLRQRDRRGERVHAETPARRGQATATATNETRALATGTGAVDS